MRTFAQMAQWGINMRQTLCINMVGLFLAPEGTSYPDTKKLEVTLRGKFDKDSGTLFVKEYLNEMGYEEIRTHAFDFDERMYR